MAVPLTRNSLIAAASAGALGASTVTASTTNTANALLILAVAYGDTGGAPAAPTVTGLSLTWVKIDNQESGNVGFAFYRAMGASATGSLTITWAAGTDSAIWALCEFVGAAQTGTNGSGAIIQTQKTNAGSQTAMTMTFGATPRADSAIYAGVGHNDTAGTMTAGAAGFTKRDDTTQGTPSQHLATEDNMSGSATTTVNINSSVAGNFGFIGLEIAPLTVGLTSGNQGDAGAIATAEAFGSPIVTLGSLDISGAGGIDTAEAFGLPTILVPNNTVWPTFYIEAAFSNYALDTDASVTWTDITAYMRSFHLSRSRSRELAKFDAGSLSVVLDNRDGRFSPEYSSGAYFPYIRPRKRVRVRAAHGSTVVSLINVYANSWSERFVKPKDAICVLDGTDGFKILAGYELPDVWSLAVTALLPTAWYKLDERSGTAALDSIRGATGVGVYVATSTLNATALVPGADSASARAVTFSAAGEVTVATSPLPSSASATSISYRSGSKAYNASGVSSLTVTKPSGAASGDLLLAFVEIRGDKSISSAPSGWTLLAAASGNTGSTNNDAKLATYYKVAGSSEPASYTWTQASSGDIAITIGAFTGVDTTTPIDVSGVTTTASQSSTSCAAPTVTTTGVNRLLVTGHGFNPATTTTAVCSQTPPSGMTEKLDTASQGPGGSQANRATVELNILQVAAAGATGTKTSTLDANDGANVGAAVALKPASGAGSSPTPFTIAFWLAQSADQTANADAYVKQGTSVTIYQDTGTKKVRFALNTTAGILESANVVPATGAACLVVARYDGSLGMKLDTSSNLGSVATITTALGAAVTVTNGTFEFGLAQATMDDVAVWGSYLSDTQVATLTAVAAGTLTSPLAIKAVLDLMGWPSDLRADPTGTGTPSGSPVTVSNTTSAANAGDKALDYMQDITTTERGVLYMTGDGKVAFETNYYLKNAPGRVIPAGNLLTDNQADLETDTTGWAAETNCSISRSTAAFNTNAACLALTAGAGAAAGVMNATTLGGTSGMAVVVGQTYTVSGYLRTAVTARLCEVKINWYNSAGTFISTSTSPQVTDSTTFAQISFAAVAPATAAFAQIGWNVYAAANTEVHYFDTMRFGVLAFGQAAGEIGYDDLAPDYSDQIIVNDVEITNTTTDAGTVAAYSEKYSSTDADSISEFGRTTLSITTNYDAALTTRAAAAASRMTFELSRYAQPQQRIQSLTISGTPTAADWDTLLALLMLNRVHVNHVAPALDPTTGAATTRTISKDYTIRGFDLDYTVSPESIKLVIGLDEGAV